MILMEEHFESTCVCQTKMCLFVITFLAKQAMIEYYGYFIKLRKHKISSIQKLSTPVQKATHLNCFWTLFPYLLLQVCPVVAAEICYVDLHVRRNSSQCCTCWKCPHNYRNTQMSQILLYIQASKLQKATLSDLQPPLPLLAKETLFDLEVDLQKIKLSSPASLAVIPPEFDLDSKGQERNFI